jgi:glucosylglycerate synthase
MTFTETNPQGITRADIVVGIPSYNEAASIAFPTRQADIGLVKYFEDRSAVIVNCDNHSPDNTGQAFLNTETTTPKIYISTDEGITGKGANLRNLFGLANQLQAKALVLIDADLQSITPLWIRNLCEPLFEQYEFVAPLYVRHKHEGPITNNIAYPLTRTLYGRRVRQPIGGDYGISGNLAKIFFESDVWSEDISRQGIDIWMTTTAVRSKVAVVQSFMGRSKIHKIKDVLAYSEYIFPTVIRTIFELMSFYEDFWKDVKWSRPTAVYGFGPGEVEVPTPVEIDANVLWDRFTTGLNEKKDQYAEVISPQNMNKLEEGAELGPDYFEMPTSLWAKLLFDFARAYKKRILDPDGIVSALAPLYFGKTLSFVLETQQMNTQQVEEYVEDQCLQFEKAKPYLLERWFS